MKILSLCAAGLLLFSRVWAETPNLIVINADDLGYGDIAPYGSSTPTPNLTRMAKEGRLLTSHYAAPVCSPSRASLMSGCYPKRVLQTSGVLFPVSAVGLNPQEQNIAKVLKSAGYATGCFGKWHLGDQPEFLPQQQGFDEYFGLPYSNDMGPAEDGAKSSYGEKPKKGKGGEGEKEEGAADEIGVRGPAQPPLVFVDGNRAEHRVRQAEQETLTRRCTQHATDFMRAHYEKPFFCYLATSAIHFPFYPSPEFRGQSASLLTACVQEVDWSVGQVLNTLGQLKLGEKTLVIFTSDNGGNLLRGSVNKPLRGSKGQTLEGGIRTPSIAWWPGKVPAGTSTKEMTSMMDFLPTFAALAGAKLSSAKIDGVNILPLLTGDPATPPRDHFFYFRGPDLEAVRQGPWKLQLAKGELYQLEEDIGEAHNVAEQHSEKVNALRALAQTMADDLGLKKYGPGCRPMGRVQNPHPLFSASPAP